MQWLNVAKILCVVISSRYLLKDFEEKPLPFRIHVVNI